MKHFEVLDLGEIDYQKAFDLQKKYRELRIQGKISDTLLFVSHPPVFTLGKRNSDEYILSSREQISEDRIQFVQSDRGGLVTYHGPGQIIIYFIVNIRALKWSIPKFVFLIEEIILKTLAHFHIEASRDEDYPGVWCGDDKIAAIGLHFDRGVSNHGVALNVCPNLRHYRHIIPCGIRDRGVTSMEQQLGSNIFCDEVKIILLGQMERVLKI
ncbi:MAG: lipoyl(octanoyl) transferase LipB [Deltaproteobacteria bacterium]|nr:lipoyl(octanoyl) transferase LipB [Deltaproteobacteria bacterium]